MVKKTSSVELDFTQEIKDNKVKLIKIELELTQSQLNKKYRELGEYTFNSLQRKKKLDVQTTKWKRLIGEIKELVNKINKYKKVKK